MSLRPAYVVRIIDATVERSRQIAWHPSRTSLHTMCILQSSARTSGKGRIAKGFSALRSNAPCELNHLGYVPSAVKEQFNLRKIGEICLSFAAVTYSGSLAAHQISVQDALPVLQRDKHWPCPAGRDAWLPATSIFVQRRPN